MDIEMISATLEADQAHRDFINAWLHEGGAYDDQYVTALRYHRACAEHLVDDLINKQIADISPAPTDSGEPEHVSYPHWPGFEIGCPACEAQMQANAEWEYDTREYRS